MGCRAASRPHPQPAVAVMISMPVMRCAPRAPPRHDGTGRRHPAGPGPVYGQVPGPAPGRPGCPGCPGWARRTGGRPRMARTAHRPARPLIRAKNSAQPGLGLSIPLIHDADAPERGIGIGPARPRPGRGRGRGRATRGTPFSWQGTQGVAWRHAAWRRVAGDWIGIALVYTATLPRPGPARGCARLGLRQATPGQDLTPRGASTIPLPLRSYPSDCLPG